MEPCGVFPYIKKVRERIFIGQSNPSTFMDNNAETTRKTGEETVREIIPTRRKFVWGLGVLSVFSGIALLARTPFSGKKNVIACAPEKKRMVKMLTQDGKLVEIDASL